MFRSLLAALLLTLALPAAARDVSVSTPSGASAKVRVDGTGTLGFVFVIDAADDAAAWATVRGQFVTRDATVVTVPLPDLGADATAQVDVVRGVVAWLRKQGGIQRLALVGSGVGGNVALAAASGDPTVTHLVLVSPRLAAPGLKLTDDVAGNGTRPVLLVSGADDDTGGRASAALAGKLGTAAHTTVVPRGRFGAALFGVSPTLDTDLVRFVREEAIAGVTGRPASAAQDLERIETTGKKLGE